MPTPSGAVDREPVAALDDRLDRPRAQRSAEPGDGHLDGVLGARGPAGEHGEQGAPGDHRTRIRDEGLQHGSRGGGEPDLGPVEEDAVVGPDSTLKDVEVGAGARVVRTHAELAVIGAGADVGPFSYLRPGTQLGAGGKIGAYVETKNASIGEGAKVPHLSYVGDAEIGEGTNIGAGTIFANYDGVKKHHTTVGAHARTASNNTFVAPVTIGDLIVCLLYAHGRGALAEAAPIVAELADAAGTAFGRLLRAAQR